jgi:hypothetical protein
MDGEVEGEKGYWAFEVPYGKLEERQILIGKLYDAVGTGAAVVAAGSEDPLIQTAAHIETMEDGDTKIEYVQVTGWPDFDIQTKLNEELETFFTWPLVDAENPDKNITTTADYAIIGNKYISVRAYDMEYTQGTAHPVSNLRAMVFDLETGESAGNIAEFIEVGNYLSEAILDGRFVQIYPDEPIDGADETLMNSISDISNNFYLTENGMVLFVTDMPQATGGYWVFEAPYESIQSLLNEKLLSAIN